MAGIISAATMAAIIKAIIMAIIQAIIQAIVQAIQKAVSSGDSAKMKSQPPTADELSQLTSSAGRKDIQENGLKDGTAAQSEAAQLRAKYTDELVDTAATKLLKDAPPNATPEMLMREARNGRIYDQQMTAKDPSGQSVTTTPAGALGLESSEPLYTALENELKARMGNSAAAAAGTASASTATTVGNVNATAATSAGVGGMQSGYEGLIKPYEQRLPGEKQKPPNADTVAVLAATGVMNLAKVEGSKLSADEIQAGMKNLTVADLKAYVDQLPAEQKEYFRKAATEAYPGAGSDGAAMNQLLQDIEKRLETYDPSLRVQAPVASN